MRWPIALVLAGVLAACQQSTVEQQKAALTLAPDSMAHRQMQMRRFDTKDEGLMTSASAGVLQDLGFTLEESSVSTGLLVASKDRDAVELGQVAGQLFLAAL